MRHNSERVPGKNYRPLAGRPLFHHIVSTLLDVPAVDEVVIDTDSDAILDDARSHFPDLTLLRRPEHLSDGTTPMNDVLLNVAEQVSADVLVQTHSTNPFLAAATIGGAVDRYLTGPSDLTSVFGVTRMQARLWSSEGAPVNHDPAVLLRTQDLEPLYVENSCFYVFAPEMLRSTGNRLGSNPLMYEVPALEAVDIDEESDFALASALALQVTW